MAAPTPEQHALDEFRGIHSDVDAGLSDLLEHGEPGRGFAEVTAGADASAGGFVRGEAGWLPRKNLALFGFGQASTAAPSQAGIGARWAF